jgi:hypothetical protein
MRICDWTGVEQDIGGRWRATREGHILFGKWGHRKRKSKKEASATAIIHKLIQESDNLLSNSDLYTYKEAVDVTEKSGVCLPKTTQHYQI